MKQITLIIFGWLVLGITAHAASFDCAKAATKVEKLICDNPEISKLDEELAAAYKAPLRDKTKAKKIREQRSIWYAQRDNCKDVECLKDTLEIRLSAVKELLAAAPEPNTKYLMMAGKGQAICEQVFKQMNEDPPLCAMDLLASIPGVELPKWKKLDWQQNKLLYKRYLLAQMVKEEHYPQLFGSPGNKTGAIVLPAKEQLTKSWIYVLKDIPASASVTDEMLEHGWKSAVESGNELYRWDGAVPAPNETDVILVEIRKHRETEIEVGGCPEVMMMPFSADLRMPKLTEAMKNLYLWFPQSAEWQIYPGKFSFKFNGQHYGVSEEGGLSRDSDGMLAVPFRTLNVNTDRGSYCMFHTNYSFVPQ